MTKGGGGVQNPRKRNYVIVGWSLRLIQTRNAISVRADQVTNVNGVRVRMDFGGSAKFGYLKFGYLSGVRDFLPGTVYRDGSRVRLAGNAA